MIKYAPQSPINLQLKKKVILNSPRFKEQNKIGITNIEK